MQRRMVLVLSVAALFALNVGASDGMASNFSKRGAAGGVDSDSFRIAGQLSGTGWTVNSPIPEPLGVAQGSAVASADGSRIYYIGGITGALVATNKVRVYFPEYDVWFDAADIPVSPGIRTFGSAVELNSFIYVFGGFDGTNVLDTTWIYDETNDVWFQGANMPGPRFGSAVAADGAIIWVLAGAEWLSVGGETETVWHYDTNTDAWVYYDHGPFMGRLRSVMLPNWDLYFLGGGFDGNFNCLLNVHTPFSGSCRPQIPFGVTDAAIVTDGLRIYVVGGAGPAPRTEGRTQIFNPVSRTWSLGPPAPVVDNTSGVVVNGTLYVLGGYDGTSPVSINYSLPLSSLGAQETSSTSWMNSDALEVFDHRELNLKNTLDEPNPWSINWPIPEAFGVAQGSTVASNDGSLIYHIGGWVGSGGYVSNRLRVYSPADDTHDASSMRSPWWDAAPVPESYGIRSYGSAVELNGFIYVFGGASATVLNTTWIYDEANDVWFRGVNMPGFRLGPAVATDGAVIWVIGGYNQVGPDHTVWLYDPRTDGYVTGFRDMPNDLGRIHGVWLPDGTIHVLGGNSPSLGSHLVYDTAANTWSSAPPMPLAVLDPAVVTDGTLIYLAGASDFPRGPAHTQIFDPASGTWSEGPLLPPWPRLGDWGVDNTSGTIANDVFYVMGGFTSGCIFFNYSIPLSKLRVLNR